MATKRVTLLNIDGTKTDLGQDDSLSAMQNAVQGYVEVMKFKGFRLLVNEDGIPRNLPLNKAASEMVNCPVFGPAVMLENSRAWG